jgi:hypothetical protein
MLVQRNAPVPEIKALKEGDVYMGSVIKTLKKKGRIISFITVEGDIYNAHMKNKYYNVFRSDRSKRRHEKRRAERAARKAEIAARKAEAAAKQKETNPEPPLSNCLPSPKSVKIRVIRRAVTVHEQAAQGIEAEFAGGAMRSEAIQ